MRKLSTILKIVLSDYIKSNVSFQKSYGKSEKYVAYPGLCISLLDSHREKQITQNEFEHLDEFLKERRNFHTFLADYLKDSNKPYNRPARIIYYKNLIKELEENGD